MGHWSNTAAFGRLSFWRLIGETKSQEKTFQTLSRVLHLPFNRVRHLRRVSADVGNVR